MLKVSKCLRVQGRFSNDHTVGTGKRIAGAVSALVRQPPAVFLSCMRGTTPPAAFLLCPFAGVTNRRLGGQSAPRHRLFIQSGDLRGTYCNTS